MQFFFPEINLLVLQNIDPDRVLHKHCFHYMYLLQRT